MKILVHLHLYYADMLPEMINRLRSLEGRDYDLYVTLGKDDPLVKKDILSFKNDARILIVDNRGYDLAPFLAVLHEVDLDKYDYLIKLHTKRDLPAPAELPRCCFRGSQWRECLTGFMKDRTALDKALKLFIQKPEIGMLSHYKLLISAAKEDREANRRAEEIMQKLGLKVRDRHFIAGTMFICRAGIMKPLLRLPYTAADFDVPAADHAGGTLAHALERVLSWLVAAQGFAISSYTPRTLSALIQIAAYKCKRFLYRKHTNSKGITRIKICKIPVYKNSRKKL